MRKQIKKRAFMTCIGGGALAFALAASPVFADEGAGTPVTSKSATVHGSGTVTAIDKSSRMVTVKTESGDKRSFQVPSEVKEFDKLKTGDKIDVDYTQSMAISMLEPGTKPSASDKAAAMRTGQGAGAVGEQVTISAKVVSVDPANNTVTFKGPKGQIETVDVQDPDNQARLSSLKPGQVLKFTYTEAMAVSVTPSGK